MGRDNGKRACGDGGGDDGGGGAWHALLELRPTQIAVGAQQVRAKARKMRRMGRAERRDFLDARPVPCVRGPGARLYIVDHHHLCAAVLSLAGGQGREERVRVRVLLDLSHLGEDAFWAAMHERHYVWPYDEYGNRVELARLPRLLPATVAGLKNDPYRAIAAVARKAGAFAKDWTPFSEFLWANHFRACAGLQLRADQDEFSEREVAQALRLAAHADAAHLPGYQAAAAAALD